MNCNDNNICTNDSCDKGTCINTLISNCETKTKETKENNDEIIDKQKIIGAEKTKERTTPISYSEIAILITIIIIGGIAYYKKENILKILKK